MTNDIALVTLGVLVLLLGIWAGVVGGSIAIRWLFRTSGVQWLARFGEGVARLARTVALVLSALTVVAGLMLLSFGIWQELDFQRWAERGA
ncbi:MAG: mechanosensitive ion channel family protein, partial [Nannocystaceae bacterium]